MTKIIAYSPEIYPIYLYVGTRDNLEEANKLFDAYDTISDAANNTNPGKISFEKDTTTAITIAVREIATGSIGLLILIDLERSGSMSTETETISHESVHVADGMFDHLGLTKSTYEEGNEHYAYLVGWVAGKVSNYIIEYKKNERARKSNRR
jgi:hypothetical protein